MPTPPRPLSPREAQQALQKGELLPVDVREGWEVELAPFPGATHLPLGALHHRLDELPADRPLLFICHHGVRSWHACMLAAEEGRETANLEGGIDAWSFEIDSDVPRY